MACGFFLLLTGRPLWAGATESAEPRYEWRHEEGASLALLVNGKTLWQVNFRKEEGKPYFHPVCTADGTVLTWLRPADHRWHRATWFSWKLINGLNYWEENRQGVSQGRTEVADVKIDRRGDGTAIILMHLDYRPPDKPPVLKERRLITITPPDKGGCYRMDWHMTFTARDKDVLFDRTKTRAEGGPAWGGYSGLSFRAAKSMTDYQTLDSEGRRNMAGHGKHARWMDFSGVVDRERKRAAGVAMFDHPANPRHPTPWYIIMSGRFGYFSPAFLFDKPYRLSAGKSFTLAYRILIHPGRGDKKRLEKESRDFSALRFDTKK